MQCVLDRTAEGTMAILAGEAALGCIGIEFGEDSEGEAAGFGIGFDNPRFEVFVEDDVDAEFADGLVKVVFEGLFGLEA